MSFSFDIQFSSVRSSNNFMVIISSRIKFLLEFINSSCLLFCLVSGSHIQ